MDKASSITMIPLSDLEHHPDNPRKDLGDLTELTASIKTNGILQNLTVVFEPEHAMTPAEWEKLSAQYGTKPTDELRQMMNSKRIPDRYLVVIGNRRLEAARAADIKELPCVISEMDHKQQVATMLEENMQRQDLTVYEQAEGFQMMMDLGYTEKQIGEKTGFSRKTIKDRLKLTKLSKENFSSAVQQGATLMDLVEVTKLESTDAQNEVLKAAGTENFRQRMMSALQKQDLEKNKARLEPVLKELMKMIPEKERYGSYWERCWNQSFKMSGTEADLRKHIQEQIMTDSSLMYRYFIDEYGSGEISFYKSKPKSTGMTEEQKTERQKSLIRGKHLRYVKSFWEQAYELRKDFVKNYSIANGQSSATLGKILLKYALTQHNAYDGCIPKSHDWNDTYLREVFSLPADPEEDPEYEKDPEHPYHKEWISVWDQIDRKIPIARAMVAWAVAGGVFWPDAPTHGSYSSTDGSYQQNSYENSSVRELYDFLVEIGYQLSDMEKQLLDGTHECYKME